MPPLANTSSGSSVSDGAWDRGPTTETGLPTTIAQEIDQLLDNTRPWLLFPEHLEQRFQADYADQRLRSLIFNGLLVAVVFNVMLWSDWLMVPDVFDLALRLRLFVFSPLTIAGVVIVTWSTSPVWREWMTFLWGILAAAINIAVCVSSRDPMAGPYLVSLVPIVMFANSVARMRFIQSIMMDAVVVGAYLWAISHTPDAPLEVMAPASLVLLSAATFTLYSCYKLERDERRNWLLHLRESMLLAHLEQANAHLDNVSKSDLLTGLANRRRFDAFLEQVWERARVDGSEISLMLIDIDHFKAYNDRYGQAEGDACLREIAAILTRRLRRPGDLTARFGGEEFIVILAGTPLATAATAAERVRKGVEDAHRQHATSSTHSVVTVSIGVASVRPNVPHSTPAQLLAILDEALHQAKSRGRNRVFAFGTHD